MKKILIALLLVISFCGYLAVSQVSVSVVSAAPSCTGWMKQNDGSYWRTCVDDKGKQYCERSKNGYISRVSCN